MKEQPLTITERHSSDAVPPDQVIHQVITAWLIKELHKSI